ncbi:BTB/POZ domain-containing protein 9-like protein, partial [Dinothrombium tinctorium]
MDVNESKHKCKMESSEFAVKLLTKLYSDDQLSDVCFVVENEKITAHKVVLAASCPYFRVLLFGETNESKSERIVLKETSKNAFKSVIEFIYKGSIKTEAMSSDDLLALISLSHEYQFKELFEYVKSKFKSARINLENVSEIFKVASFCDIDPLLCKCWKFIDENAETIIRDLNLFACFPFSLIKKIIGRKTFVVANELEIVNALSAWNQLNPNHDISTLLKRIKLDQIKLNDFLTHVRPIGFFTDREYLEAINRKKRKREESESESELNIRKIKYTDYGCKNIEWRCDCFDEMQDEPLQHFYQCDKIREVEIEFKTTHKVNQIKLDVHYSKLKNDSEFWVQVGSRKSNLKVVYNYIFSGGRVLHHHINFRQ